MTNMKPKIHTLFQWCNDVSQMREFYSDVLGLGETYFLNDDKHGWLTYEVEGLQLVFMRGSKPLPVESVWARQPGWIEGTAETASLLLQVSVADFHSVVERARARNVKIFDQEPRTVTGQQLSHFMMDPMGITIELYCETQNPV